MRKKIVRGDKVVPKWGDVAFYPPYCMHGKLVHRKRSEGEEEERTAGLPPPPSMGISLPTGLLFYVMCSWSRRAGTGLVSLKADVSSLCQKTRWPPCSWEQSSGG